MLLLFITKIWEWVPKHIYSGQVSWWSMFLLPLVKNFDTYEQVICRVLRSLMGPSHEPWASMLFLAVTYSMIAIWNDQHLYDFTSLRQQDCSWSAVIGWLRQKLNSNDADIKSFGLTTIKVQGCVGIYPPKYFAPIKNNDILFGTRASLFLFHRVVKTLWTRHSFIRWVWRFIHTHIHYLVALVTLWNGTFHDSLL